MNLKEYLEIRDKYLEGEIDDDTFIRIHESFAEEFSYDVEDEDVEEVLKRLFGYVVKDKQCSCGDLEAVHYYSPWYDLCIHVCVSDPENPVIMLHPL